jgi:hypothetical protein
MQFAVTLRYFHAADRDFGCAMGIAFHFSQSATLQMQYIITIIHRHAPKDMVQLSTLAIVIARLS